MRLYDYLRELDTDFPDCLLLVGNEVADMIDSLDNREEETHPASFYGCVSPPFPRFFIEARKAFTSKQVVAMYGDDEQFIKLYKQSDLGTLVTERGMFCEDITDDPRAKRGEHLIDGGDLLPAGTRWILRFTGYTRQNGHLSMYAGRCFIHLDEQGHILDDLKRVYTTMFREDEREPTIDYLQPEYLAKMLPFVLKTIGLLHQKAEIEEVRPSRQVKRLAKRKGKPEPKPFYFLKIKERAKRRVSLSEITRKSKAMREHKVRGHFKVYGQAGRGLLFGKYEKTVWVPAHSRGDSSLGSLDKGYEIKTAN